MYDNFKIIFDCTNEKIIDLICEDNPEYTFMGIEPILILERAGLRIQIITNTKQVTYEREYEYKPFRKIMGKFLNWYYKNVQKNDDNHIINNIGNKILFLQGLKKYFNITLIKEEDIMDNIYTVTYFDEPMLDNEAFHYLLEKEGNIISAGGSANYIINKGDHFSSCTVADIGDNYTLSELATTFFNNDKVWFKGTFEKTDNLKEIQQSVVDVMEKVNEVALKNEEISFLKKEELYDMLLFHMKAMYHYFNNDCKNLTIDVNIGNSEHSENK